MFCRVFLILAYLLVALTAFPQKTKKVSAEYTFYAPSSMSIDEAKCEAIERAKLQALADAFGTRIAQISNTRVSNGEEKSMVDFFSSGTNEVMGEWIETIGQPVVEIDYSDNMLVVKATVKGKARPLTKQRISLSAKVLRNSMDENSESDNFSHGDNVFLSFQTPVSGSLLVYLIDYTVDQVFCLLPYASSDVPSFEVHQDTHYVFFSEKDAPEKSDDDIDEYTLTCAGQEVEHNEMVILFSTDHLVKENTSRIAYNLPRQVSLEDFNKWLTKMKVSDPNVYIINKLITIKPKKS